MDLGSVTLTLFQVAIELEYAKSMFDLHKKSHPNDEIVGWWVHVLLRISSRLFTWCHRLENSPLDCRILRLKKCQSLEVFFLTWKVFSFFSCWLTIFTFTFFLTIWTCSIVFEVDYKMYGELKVWFERNFGQNVSCNRHRTSCQGH